MAANSNEKSCHFYTKREGVGLSQTYAFAPKVPSRHHTATINIETVRLKHTPLLTLFILPESEEAHNRKNNYFGRGIFPYWQNGVKYLIHRKEMNSIFFSPPPSMPEDESRAGV
jgi:hypothetical protein